MNVTVLGSGAWGTALAIELNAAGHNVIVWGHNPTHVREINQSRANARYLPGITLNAAIEFTADLQNAIADSQFIVMATPSKAMRETAAKLNSFSGTIVSVSKGIEHDTGLTMAQILQQQLPESRVAVLSGPTFAPEVARGMPSAAVAASASEEAASLTQEVFHRPAFRVYTNRDIIGVELGGALKNVIAIAAGMCDGLGFGDNSKAALVTRALAEMSRVGVACGAKARTFSGLSGLGDLTVTCFSPQSRNRALGERIGKGEKIADILPTLSAVAEGYPNAKSAAQLVAKLQIDAPIIRQVHAILYENKPPLEALHALVTRDSKSED
ncbi:MAG TPA: NAD(P)H-dependent glycerol-3-phosphate dehydrogenase [Verrucomicrobiae bacterium]|nr:NAD(P)H-dependent glycerol-3-phosphate dehydrogenase [Verrucomicrobiae bacterium]